MVSVGGDVPQERQPLRTMLERVRGPSGFAAMFTAIICLALPGSASDEPQDGADLYLSDCASCHGPAGDGTRRGPSLRGAGEASNYYYLRTGRMPIESPGDPVRRGPVPYSEEQLIDLVAYASRLGDGPALPEVSTGTADVARGGDAYRLQCAICHGAAGEGGALAAQGYAPSLGSAGAADVVAAVAAGPGSMPSFEAVLSPEEMSEVAAYVSHLQDPGGVARQVPGGRVGEGLVGLAAAAFLVVLARLIGDSV